MCFDYLNILAKLTDSVNGSEVYTLKPVVNPAQKQPASWLKDSDKSSFNGFRGCSDIAKSSKSCFQMDLSVLKRVGKLELNISFSAGRIPTVMS